MDPKEIDVSAMPEMDYPDIFGIVSGVYFIYTQDYKELLYIGQSRNRLRRRVMQHINKLRQLGYYTENDQYYYARYKVIPVEKDKLDEVEAFYIRKFMPPLNLDKNPSKDKIAYDLWFWNKMQEYDKAHGIVY